MTTADFSAAEKPRCAGRPPLFIIFTDLDGTLLERWTYSWKAARPALRRLARLQLPLVFCSSKTRAEIMLWRRRLRNFHPFVSENGGGVFLPPGYFTGQEDLPLTAGLATIALGSPYTRLRQEFIDLRQQTGVAVRGFGDMTLAEVAALTGLSRGQARLARQRDFDEPFIFMDGSDDRFLQAVKVSGRRWTSGMLYHLMGEHDKGLAVRMLLERFAGKYGQVASVGLGDAFNDLPMLRSVDRPFLVGQPGGGHDDRVDFPGLIKTPGEGPTGWNEAVMRLLDEAGCQA